MKMKTKHQNLWHVLKTVLRGKFSALNVYKISNSTFHLRKLGEKKEEIKSKVSSRIRITAEINYIENRKPVEKNQ